MDQDSAAIIPGVPSALPNRLERLLLAQPLNELRRLQFRELTKAARAPHVKEAEDSLRSSEEVPA